MTNADIPRLAKLLALLSETFNEPVSDLKLEGYFEALKEHPIEAVETAGMHAFKYSKFFPRPAHFQDFIYGDREQLARIAEMALLGEIRRVGYTGRPKLTDATWEAVIAIWGSWQELCNTLPASGYDFEMQMTRFRDIWQIKNIEIQRARELEEHARKALGS
jgi:hypothetical protein